MMEAVGLTGDPVYPKILNLKQPVPLGYAGEKIAKGFNKLVGIGGHPIAQLQKKLMENTKNECR